MCDARQRVPAKRGEACTQRIGLGIAGASGEKAAGRRGEPLADGHSVLDTLAGAVDHLRPSLPERAMMVDGGEVELFERKVPQALEGSLGSEPAAGDLGEKACQLLRGHATWASGAR